MTSELEFVSQVAREAGALLRDGYGQAQRVSYKGDVDLVTEYDRRSETLILRRLRAQYPDHAMVAEESGRSGDHAFEWLIDPLDGTTNFAHGIPCFAVSIGLAHAGRMLLGVVYDPLRDELFVAEAGHGAHLNGRAVRVSAEADLGRALLTTGFPYDVRTSPVNNFREWELFYRTAQAVRRPGSAALDCCYVACGRFDGYWEYKMKAYDVGPGALIALEAGGRVTTAAGQLDWLGADSIVVSNGHLHQAMLAVLRQAR
jgi:myo-inositol-1(or 4)-monophosphatase